MALVNTSLTDGIAHLQLNRAEARNAFSRELIEEFRTQLEMLGDSADVKVLIISGAGGKAFAAGADIAELVTRTAGDAFSARLQKLFQAVEDFPRPTIAAIDGYALGGGLELALACDLRVASRDATLGLPEVTLGIFPSAGASARLPQLVGVGRARELIFTGRLVKAEEALRLGLVEEVVASDAVGAAVTLAKAIAANDASAVRAAKVVINAAVSGARVAPMEWLGQASLVESKEKQARMHAFLEKRAAKK